MANTNKGRKFYIAVTVADNAIPSAKATAPANAAAYAAFAWTQVKNVGSITEMGIRENIVNYDELETTVIQKSKGLINAGDPTVEVARNVTDNGQKAMRAAALTKLNYAFKITDDDMPSGGTTPTTYYNWGMVTGPTRPGGRAEDFILEVFTLALNALETVVDAV
jgi:hypothetical protein